MCPLWRRNEWVKEGVTSDSQAGTGYMKKQFYGSANVRTPPAFHLMVCLWSHTGTQKKERSEAQQCQGKKRNTLKMPKIYGYLLLLPYLWDCNMALNYLLSESFNTAMTVFCLYKNKVIVEIDPEWCLITGLIFSIPSLLIEMSNIWQQVWSKSARLIAIYLWEWMPTRTFIPRLLCWYFRKRVRIQPQPQANTHVLTKLNPGWRPSSRDTGWPKIGCA